MRTTDFDVLLDNVEDLEDAYCLDQTIRTESNYGNYNIEYQGELMIIKSDILDDELILASETAKEYFLDLLEKKWASEPGMSISISYDVKRAMEKDD